MSEQGTSQSNESIQSSKHIWIIIIAVITTAVIVGSGVYVWQMSRSQLTEKSLRQQIVALQSQIENFKGVLLLDCKS